MSLILLVILCTVLFWTSAHFLPANHWYWSSWKNCYSLKSLTYYRALWRQKFLFISEILLCKSGNHSVHMQGHIHHNTDLSSTNLPTQAFLEKLECLVFFQGEAALSQSWFFFLVLGCLFSKPFLCWTWQSIGWLWKAFFPGAPVLTWDSKDYRTAECFRLEWTFVVFWCKLSSQSRVNIMSAC